MQVQADGSRNTRLVNHRPLSVTVVGWTIVAVGCMGLARHVANSSSAGAFEGESMWVLLIRLLAIVCGVFTLRGKNWARWLLVVWLGYHVGLSSIHSPFTLIVHSLLFAGLMYLLFRQPASAYFRGTMAAADP